MENKSYLYREFHLIQYKVINDLSALDTNETSGLVFTLLLSKLDELNMDMDEFRAGLRDLADEMEKYTYKTDTLVKNLLSKQRFDSDDAQFIQKIVSLKNASQEISEYVTQFLNNNPADYETLIELSTKLFNNIRDFFNITLTLDIDKSDLELCFEYFKFGLSQIVDSFRKYIIENHKNYLYPEKNEYYTPYQLGYMILSFNFLEDMLNVSPIFYLFPSTALNYPKEMYDIVTTW